MRNKKKTIAIIENGEFSKEISIPSEAGVFKLHRIDDNRAIICAVKLFLYTSPEDKITKINVPHNHMVLVTTSV